MTEEVKQTEFDEINDSLNTSDVFGNAKDVRNIASAHQIQVADKKMVTLNTSSEGYD